MTGSKIIFVLTKSFSLRTIDTSLMISRVGKSVVLYFAPKLSSTLGKVAHASDTVGPQVGVSFALRRR